MSGAFHLIEVNGDDDWVQVVHLTNDDDDDGRPDGQVASWSYTLPRSRCSEGRTAIEEALAREGKSRRGISGVEVEVIVNGERV